MKTSFLERSKNGPLILVCLYPLKHIQFWISLLIHVNGYNSFINKKSSFTSLSTTFDLAWRSKVLFPNDEKGHAIGSHLKSCLLLVFLFNRNIKLLVPSHWSSNWTLKLCDTIRSVLRLIFKIITGRCVMNNLRPII